MVRSHTRRSTLMLGGAGLAMAAALALPEPAAADAFNGTPSFVRGTGTVDRSVTNVDTITITSATAVLDWTIFEDNFGNALTFLPNGSTAYFQDGPGQGGFAVLNRILPSTNGNVVVFQGSVISRLQDASGAFSNGGMVAFYSPTGILVGSNAVFDVGQLLLTTLDPDLNSFDSYAAGGTLQLTGASGATAGVSIDAGAQITATGEGSYFAVAAPQIAMRGNAYINGSTAYVAGEQVNLTYNNGLFDIQIPVGTSVANPIDHSGTTGGPSSTGSGDNHLIYAVARATTDPITMLLRGNLGFDTAATAGIDNGDIILSAGYDVFGRSVSTGAVNENALEESISVLGSATFSSSVFAGATGSFGVSSNAGAISFADGLIARGARSISLVAENGNDVTITGDVELGSQGTILGTGDVVGGTIDLLARGGAALAVTGGLFADATPTQNNGDTTGGTVKLEANGGTLTIDGDVWLRAEGNDHFTSGTLGNSFGGTTSVLASNAGSISLGGTLRMDTLAFGNGLRGRTGTGGTSEIVAQSGGRVDVAGTATLRASGYGGDADGSLGVFNGGLGMGGTAQILATGGTISFGSAVQLSAEGFGGEGAAAFGLGSGGDLGGAGSGGLANIQSTDGSITIAGLTDLLVRGLGGQGASGGNGTGGIAQVFARGTGTIDLASVSASAHGLAGDGLGANGRGGDGLGGRSIILTQDTGDISLTGDANLQANSFGGDGHTGGDAIGGNAGVYAIFGSIAIDGDAYLSTQAFGGDATVGFGGNGGNAAGGTSFIQADGSQALAASVTIGGNASAYASGYGGDGGAGDGVSIAAGDGGDGTGGTYQGTPGTGGVFAIAGRDNGTLSITGSTVLVSAGYGGIGGVGGTGQAGGRGGDGTGGTTQAGTFSGRGDGSLGNGLATFTSLNLAASGFGGQGGSGGSGFGAGGDGTGGLAGVFASQSRVDAAAISTIANGTGGFGSTGGIGKGGEAGIGVFAGTLNATSLYGSTTGTGGDATTGDGGIGLGGEVSIDLDSMLTVTGAIDYYAGGYGGASANGNGGTGQGGIARISTTGSSSLSVGSTLGLDASAMGGAGVIGGNAAGGTASLMVGSTGQVTVGGGGLLRVDATGGTGTDADGDAQGGGIDITVSGATFSAPALSLYATAFSGTGMAQGGALLFRTSAAGSSSIGLLDLDASATTGGTAQASGGSVSLAVDSLASLLIGDAIIDADGDDFGGLIDLDASGGTMEIDALAVHAFGTRGGADAMVRTDTGSILINGSASFDVSGNLTFASANGGIFGGPTVNAPTAQIFVSSQGTVRFEGDNDDHIGFGGREVFIRSRNLDILSGARIGAQFLGLGVIGNAGTTILGGNLEGQGYTLTQAELERIDAGEAYFSSSFDGLASDDILIRDMTIAGSLDNDGVSSVFIEAGGVVRVEGVLAYLDAAASDALGIRAQRLEIVTPGGIGMVDPQGNPTGMFFFQGRDLWMADASTIARLRDDPAFDGRNELLSTVAAGSADPLGYLRAGDIFLTLGDSLLVRNTGTADTPAGITVTGGLTIGGGYHDESTQNPSDAPLDVVAYGRKLNGDGSFVTGEAFFKLIEFNTEDQGDNFVTTYAEGSQFNNCDINSGACAGNEPPDEREEVLDEVEEKAPAAAVTTTEPVAAAPVEQSESDSNVEFGADFPALLSATLVSQDDAIDDPVTSGGDIALYGSGEEDPGEDEEGEDQ